jgi:hypothetical protein
LRCIFKDALEEKENQMLSIFREETTKIDKEMFATLIPNTPWPFRNVPESLLP